MNPIHPYHQQQQRRRRLRRRKDGEYGRDTKGCDCDNTIVLALTVLILALGGVLRVAEGFAVDRHGALPTEQCHRNDMSCSRNWDGAFGRCFGARMPRNEYTSLSMTTPQGGYDAGASKETTQRAIEGLMAEYDPILLFASKLLPAETAADASALYAWCRRLDEICDNEDNADNLETVRDQLEVWQARFEALWNTNDETNGTGSAAATQDYPQDDYLMDLALKQCIEKYQGGGSGDNNSNLLTRVPFDDMIQGMKSDAVENRRIQTMDDLEVYAYRVAGTVGLMLLPLLLSNAKGDREQILLAVEESREPAICLGKAIQLVNILRDATQDAKLGRIYLPQDMLAAEGVDEESILRLGQNKNPKSREAAPEGYKTVVKRVAGRALELLAVAEAGKDALPPPLGPLFVQIIVELYRDYLDELDRRDYDNLSSNSSSGQQDRVKISTLRKVTASLRAIAMVVGEKL